MGLFEGKVVVVTGAGQGIGRNHVMRFVAEGARVVVNDIGVGIESNGDGSGRTQPTEARDLSLAARLVDEIRRGDGVAIADTNDLSTFASGQALVDNAMNHFGWVDVLVNNAGTLTIMRIPELDEALVLRELSVHIIGYMGTTKAVWAPMKEQGGGVIVNTASGFGGGGPGLAAYMAAKAGVFALTRDTAFEGAEVGIRANALTPAARTRMSMPYWGADQTEHWDLNWASTLALFLASHLSEGITGRQFGLTPGNLIREMYVATNALAADAEFTPHTLAARIDEVLSPADLGSRLRLPAV